MVWVAKRINEQVLFHPRDVVTATEFNSLFNLLIAQGNNNAQGVEGLIGIFGSVTDGESGADYIKVTPISGVTGTNVQEILEGLKGLVDQRYTKSETDILLGGKASSAVVAKLVKNVQFEEGTGKFTFVFQDDTTKVIDTAMEKIAVNFSYDAETQSLVLEHADGSTESISLAEFVTNNEFSNSDTINISVVKGVVKAEIGTGVITDAMLSSTLLATLAGYVSSASGSAQAAASSESNAGTYAGTASNAAQTATQKAADASDSEAEAQRQSRLAKSYAVGETEARPGENNDNAKYYSEQADLKAAASSVSAASASSAAASASDSAQAAASSEVNAGSYAGTASNAAQTAAQKANSASDSAAVAIAQADKSKSYAVGNTGTRDGENTDNAQYYAGQAGLKASAAAESAGQAANSAENAAGSANSAAVAAQAAEQAKDKAQEIVGGDFLTKTGDGKDVTATFTEADSRTNIATGEKLSVLFGKVKKFFSDLKTVAFTGSYTDLSNKPTIPEKNKVLTGSLTVAGWTAETDGFKQTLTISGLATSGYTYTVYPNSAQYKVWTEAGIYADDVSTANSITFHCTEKPTVAVSVNIKKEQVG
jgi:hypothetical protein